MTNLIARLIMATMIFPLGIIVFIGLMAVLSTMTGSPDGLGMTIVWCVEYLFIGSYWVLLWRPLVDWTPTRIRGTIVATFLSGISGLIFGGFMLLVTRDAEVAIGLGGLAPAVSFLLLTIQAWKETDLERLERLDRAEGTPIECQRCGYDMRGLKATSCPECGDSPTLHQLFTGQSALDKHEIAQHEPAGTP